MDTDRCRKAGSLMAIGQGIVTALAPGLSAKLTQKLVGKNFENADALAAKPEYTRQTRAVGIGLAAAGVAGYVMEVVADEAASDNAEA